MNAEREVEILRPYVAACEELVNKNFKLEKELKAIDRLLLQVLMGDGEGIDPMQAMIERARIKGELE
jgi:hypothetical protein